MGLFAQLVPTYLSKYRRAVGVGTQALLVAGGVSFVVRPLRAVARWTTIGLLLASLPEAVNQVRHPERMKALGLPPRLLLLRIPIQALVIAGIWWATCEPRTTASVREAEVQAEQLV